MTRESPQHYTEERPWGNFIEFTKNEPSTVKILTVKAHEAFSLQSHSKRDEFWRVLEGEGFVSAGDVRVLAKKNDEFFIPRGAQHRIESGDSDMVVLEISSGEFDEQDITRFDDRYGRIAKK
jgi:mannose-6-phosphate isomerase